MVMFTDQEATAVASITRLIFGWANEIDRNEGLGLAPYIAADCRYMARGVPRHGPQGVVEFYTTRLEDLKQTPAGPPTQRHVISNLIVDFTAPDRARVDFLLTYYFSTMQQPCTDMNGPLAVADVWMDCTREADGHWRISSFDSVQNFIRAAS